MPSGNLPLWYSGANTTDPAGVRLRPSMQCAAVSSRSPALLRTTLAVQKCVSLPFWSRNSAPTAFVPLNARASGFRTGLRSWAASADWVTAPGVDRLSVAVSATANPVAAPLAGRASRDRCADQED